MSCIKSYVKGLFVFIDLLPLNVFNSKMSSISKPPLIIEPDIHFPVMAVRKMGLYPFILRIVMNVAVEINVSSKSGKEGNGLTD